VLQRKTEEASMATKRLKELLESRKIGRWIYYFLPSLLFSVNNILLKIYFPILQVLEMAMALEFRYYL
jgi:hypothetical protein